MSLAAIKRRVTVGSKLQVVRHDWPMLRMHGETDEQYAAKRDAFFAVRTVVVARASEIGIAVERQGPDGQYQRTSWLDWPKADSIRETANGFEVDLNRNGKFEQVMQYEYR